MARDGQIDMSYALTTEMLADCFTQPLPQSAFWMLHAAKGIIGIELGNGLNCMQMVMAIVKVMFMEMVTDKVMGTV